MQMDKLKSFIEEIKVSPQNIGIVMVAPNFRRLQRDIITPCQKIIGEDFIYRQGGYTVIHKHKVQLVTMLNANMKIDLAYVADSEHMYKYEVMLLQDCDNVFWD